MLDYELDLLDDQPLSDEGPDTKDIKKKKFYQIISSKWMIPPITSRGVDRKYLLKVHRNEVYRIDAEQYRIFNFNITSEQVKKTTVMSSALLVKKLDNYLALVSSKPLGFSVSDPPDQTWLYKVVRFVDRFNFIEAYKTYIDVPLTYEQENHNIVLLHHSRLLAFKEMFSDNQMKKNKKVREAMVAARDAYRTARCHETTMIALQRELEKANEKNITLKQNMNESMSKATLSLMCVKYPNMPIETLLKATKENPTMMREMEEATNT